MTRSNIQVYKYHTYHGVLQEFSSTIPSIVIGIIYIPSQPPETMVSVQNFDGINAQPESLPFTLHLDSNTLVAGDVLSGHVSLDLAQAQRDHLTNLTLHVAGQSIT